jgi:hypothetical protein
MLVNQLTSTSDNSDDLSPIAPITGNGVTMDIDIKIFISKGATDQ